MQLELEPNSSRNFKHLALGPEARREIESLYKIIDDHLTPEKKEWQVAEDLTHVRTILFTVRHRDIQKYIDIYFST